MSFRQKGFTIVELMVAAAISSIILIGISQLFVANSQTYNLIVGQSHMQESGRFAVNLLVRAAQMSGYKGCFSSNEELYKTFLPAIPYEFNLGSGLIGYEGETSSWSPDIEVILPKTVSGVDTNVYAASAGSGIDTDVILRGTDILTISYITEDKYRLATNMPTSSETVDILAVDSSVVSSASQIKFSTGDLVYIHDCEKGTIFRVTGFSPGFEIEHDATLDPNGYTNAVTKLADFNTFETDAYVSEVVSQTFFIAPSLSQNNVGNFPLALWRKAGVAAPVELLEGVEDLQIKYGVDTDNDDIPNRYVDADSVLDFEDVITLRITIVANSVNDVEGTKAPTHGCLGTGGRQFCTAGTGYDGLLRRAFTQTISLRN